MKVNKKVKIVIIRLFKLSGRKPLNNKRNKSQNRSKIVRVISGRAGSNLCKIKRNNFCIKLII